MESVKLYKKVDDKVQCILCPNKCILNDGQKGLCNVRARQNDQIINPYSGIISSFGLDPIEKKPLYHFYPTSLIFSVGFFGCTLKCKFCQNSSISQCLPTGENDVYSPDSIIKILKEKKMKFIAFTYSEPTLYFEWVLEVAKLCKQENIKTVLVTNGYINPDISDKLFVYIDAANIDLKSSKEEFYKKFASGKLAPVKENIKIAYSMGVHIEVANLVITNTNDSIEENQEITDFIAGISPDIPLHISRYHPSYKFTKPPTDIQTIHKLIKNSSKKLHFVYGGNILEYSNTHCKNCGEILIERNYYAVKIKNLNIEGLCKKCGADNNIRI